MQKVQCKLVFIVTCLKLPLTTKLVSNAENEVDLYEVLGITRNASKADIKKAYHKAALTSHPDKVAEHEREDAEIRFKAVSQAYEILHDEQKRNLYDMHGMSAFTRGGGSGGMGAEVDLDDILQQMFGFGMSDGGGPGPSGNPQRGKDELKEYEVTLEELYKGKSVRFASTKTVVCGSCKGSGGKEKAVAKECAMCKGRGIKSGVRSVGSSLFRHETICATCKGSGKVFRDKDKCKKCRGEKVLEVRKPLELYIPPGSCEGDRIVLQGEADQLPDQEPGDIIFELTEAPHETFRRAGADLAADLHVTLSEALTGLDRVVLTHLDGRGIQIRTAQPGGRLLRPEQVLKVAGEGMPKKRSDARGDLYLVVKIKFPDDGWLQDKATMEKLREMLPGPEPQIRPDVVDEVEFDAGANLDEFGAGSGDPRGGAVWEDEDDDDDGQPQCAQQ